MRHLHIICKNFIIIAAIALARAGFQRLFNGRGHQFVHNTVMSTKPREPEPRALHAAVGLGKRLYVWGGKGVSDAESKRLTSTVESFNVSTETWEEPQPISGGPLPDGLRNFAISTVAPGTAYLFGGNDGICQYNTIYQVDLNTLEYKKVFAKNPSEAPQGKSGCAMVYDNGRLIVFGGHSGEVETDELHVFDLKTSKLLC